MPKILDLETAILYLLFFFCGVITQFDSSFA